MNRFFISIRPIYNHLRSLFIQFRQKIYLITVVLLIYILCFYSYNLFTPKLYKARFSTVTTVIFYPIILFQRSRLRAEVKNEILEIKALKVAWTVVEPGIESPGDIQPWEKIEIVSPVAGRIVKIFVHEGERVKMGQHLVQIDQLSYVLQYKQQKAALQQSKARLTLAREKYLNARRDKEKLWKAIAKQKTVVRELKARLAKMKFTFQGQRTLYKQGAISKEAYNTAKIDLISEESSYLTAKKDLEIALVGFRQKDLPGKNTTGKNAYESFIDLNTRMEFAEVDVARAEVHASSAALNSTRQTLNQTTIKSPVAGIVAKRNFSPGEEVMSSTAGQDTTAILEIVDIVSVFARTHVREADSVKIKFNDKFTFKVDALPKREYVGPIVAISPLVDETAHTVEIKAKIGNKDLKLRPGMFLRGKIVTGKSKKMLLIPQNCVKSQKNKGQYVFIIKRGAVFRKQIKVGDVIKKDVEVIGGLMPGDVIATEKFALLRDGRRVVTAFKDKNPK